MIDNKPTDNSVKLTVNWCLATELQSSRNNNFQFIHSLFNTYVVLLISDIDIKGSDYFYNKCSSF